MLKEYIGLRVDTCFKPLEGLSSEFCCVYLCVIDHLYLLVVYSTFRDSAGYVLFAASIFYCLRTYVVFMAGKHEIGWDVCVHSNFCSEATERFVIKLSQEEVEALFCVQNSRGIS